MMEPPEKTLKEYSEEFYALQQQARAHGIDSVVILVEDNPIEDVETKRLHRCCNWSSAFGLLEWAKHLLLDEG